MIQIIFFSTNHPNYSKRLRDYGVILDNKTGKYIPAVVAEGGPEDQYREISIKASWDLGYYTDGTWGPNNGDFEFIIFNGSRTLNYNATEAEILAGIKNEVPKYLP